MTMGDRVAVMNKGVLQQVAQPQQLYDRPANLFVAAFIGTPPMNLLEGTVTGENGSLRLALGPDSLALDARASTAYPERVLLGYDLLYLTRGAPVVYYGDEVGMIGTGGDQQAGRTCSRRGSRSGRQSPASAVRGSARAPRST